MALVDRRLDVPFLLSDVNPLAQVFDTQVADTQMGETSFLILIVKPPGLVRDWCLEIWAVTVKHIDFVNSKDINAVRDRLLDSVRTQTWIGWTGKQNFCVDGEVLRELRTANDLLRCLRKSAGDDPRRER